MTSYTFWRCTSMILIVLTLATAVCGQVAPTPEQMEFVNGLVTRIRSKSQGEVTTLQTRQLQPAITAEQQAERIRNDLVGQSYRLAGRIECLNWLAREHTRMGGVTDQNGAQQQINLWRRELMQLNQQLATVNARGNAANAGLNDARERRLAAERNVETRQAANIQQLSDLRYLYDTARLTPPRLPLETLMERVAAVAREKQLTSNVTITTGAVPVTDRYQLVSGGEVLSARNCTRCVVPLPVGNYNFWVETAGSPGPQRRAYLIFAESHSIQISTPNPTTVRRVPM